MLSDENNKRFALSADGAFVLHFEKGETFHFFLCLKEKSSKKEADNPQVDGLSSLGIAATKARSLFANACASADYSLGERNFAACGSLSL